MDHEPPRLRFDRPGHPPTICWSGLPPQDLRRCFGATIIEGGGTDYTSGRLSWRPRSSA